MFVAIRLVIAGVLAAASAAVLSADSNYTPPDVTMAASGGDIGSGKTWVNIKGSTVVNQVYHNSGASSLFISSWGYNPSLQGIAVSPDGVNFSLIAAWPTQYTNAGTQAIVPPGWYWKVTATPSQLWALM